MKGKKKRRNWPLIVLMVVLASIAVGLTWMVCNFYVVDFALYAKDTRVLDLRSQEISIRHYEKVRSVLPNCEVRWDVPFQGGKLADDTTEVTVTSLSEEDITALTLLPKLKTVHAEACTDYDALQELQQRLPQVEVYYGILLSGQSFAPDTTAIEVTGITGDELKLLKYLPKLESVVMCGNAESVDFTDLYHYCVEEKINFGIRLGEIVVSCGETALIVSEIAEEEVYLLGYLEKLTKVHFVNPQASVESLLALRENNPQMQVSWEIHMANRIFQDTDTEIDMSAYEITDLEQLEATMEYFPNAELLTLGLCGVDNPEWENSKSTLAASPIENEDLAAFRDRVREDYKVVWTVRLGPSIALRTDKDNFMPNHFGVGVLTDEYAYNLRYCEDMVCLDVGHMTLTDISFVEFMPKLKYLILAWTEVQYIEPIRSCKNLVFLELDNSCIRDISPLVDCTALEDLNIGNTWPDVTPLTQMPWLKNVYMIFGSKAGAWTVSQALPDTHVVSSGNATVGGNWRRLQNYYDMRDCLGMYYMN